MINRREARRLLGESARDIGILVLVFGPLDAFFQERPPGALAVAVMVVVGLSFILLGIIIQTKE